MLKISSTYTIFFLLLANLAFGQFGNEWIDGTQSYYKIKVVRDDFYRVTQAELLAVGFPISSVPASRIQLFRSGEEIAISVNTNGDGTLNYLEFYGQAIDGTSDTELYDLGDQPHTLYNLFSDTAVYFLTYKLGNENGKRIAFSSDQNSTGLTAESSHTFQDLQVFATDYAPGIRFGSGASFTLSKYDEGEGWTGPFLGKAGFTNYDFVLNNRVGGQDPVCDFVLVGGNSLSHNANISAGINSSSLSSIGTVQFNGWESSLSSFTVPSSSIDVGGELTIQVLREGFPDVSERFSVAYMRVSYDQEISMTSSENKVFTLSNPTAPKAYLQIATTNAAGTSVFDISNPIEPIRLATANFSDRVEVVVPNFIDGHQVLATTTPATVASIEGVKTYPDLDLSSINYLIITHKKLRLSGDPVNDYKNYRESVLGGGYNVAILNVDELYDRFNFGDPSPLGIRRFIQYAESVGDQQNVFIIGKGFTLDNDYYRGAQTEVNIPTFGLPGSDLMYTLGINTDPDLPGIPIGRLNAFTTDDVTAYLSKIQEMEALPFDDLWRKDFLQLSGGITQGELNVFADFVQGFTDVLEQDFIGGRAFNTGKETNESVEFVDVADRINQGVGYVTFFGHSSGTVTDIEIGRVSNPEFGFQNQGRYPIFLVNGCKAGEIFGSNFTFGEDWMITPNLGAIGFIAHADFATASTLRRWSDLFYEIGFGNDVFIGETIGNVLLEVSSQYIAENGNGNTSLTQVQQMLYEGDPAYRIFGADSPDYSIDNSSVYAEATQGSEILAVQDSFKINIVVKNFGRSVSDSLIVQVDRTFANGSTSTYVNQFLRPLRQDTLEFFIVNEATQDNSGQNLFNIFIDPSNATPELDESNNSASLELSIFSGNTSHLFPIDNGTTGSNQVNLVWQSSNLLEEERSFDIEIDSEATFDSPNRRSFTVSSELIANLSFDFSQYGLPDSTTFYWRTRFTNPEPDETDEWVTTSFTVIDNITDGWGQYVSEQQENEFVTGIEYNSSTNNWEFIQSTNPIDIFTFGIDNPTFAYEDIEAIIGGIDFMITSNTIDPVCQLNTFNAIAFDKESGDPYRPIQTTEIDVFNDEVCGRLPQRIYQFDENDILVDERLRILVENMRDGDPIVLFNMGDVTYSNWDATTLTVLNSLGISSATITGLTDGQPVIFFGKKGDAPGTAITVTNDGTLTPITQQSIELQDNVLGSFTSGSIRTRRIGPASDWLSYSFNLTEEPSDNYTLSVFGVDENGVATSIPAFERSRSETIDVSSIDESVYPELELEFTFDDETNLTPPQLNFWEINYSLPPEGVVLVEDKEVATLQEGEEISRNFSFYNLSSIDFTDSLDVEFTLINQTTGNSQVSALKIAPPTSGDSTQFAARFSSFGFDGQNSIVANVMANENEMYDFNNRITLANLVNVQADETNPVLDVTFDGNHILSGDIVSPTPTIGIRMRDDNPFVFKNDTTGINISIREPGEASVFQRVNFSNAALTYTPASESQDFEITYQPGPLVDGIYGLRIQAQDESGNEAGSEPYEVDFEVINESTITHFYPYPNPFSTSCRFVFTLTGSEIPDQVKIQILTVSEGLLEK